MEPDSLRSTSVDSMRRSCKISTYQPGTITGSLSWNHIAGRDFLVLDIIEEDTSIRAALTTWAYYFYGSKLYLVVPFLFALVDLIVFMQLDYQLHDLGQQTRHYRFVITTLMYQAIFGGTISSIRSTLMEKLNGNLGRSFERSLAYALPILDYSTVFLFVRLSLWFMDRVGNPFSILGDIEQWICIAFVGVGVPVFSNFYTYYR